MTTKNIKNTMYAGNRRVFHFTIRDEADALLDLAGHTASWKMQRSIGGKPVGDTVALTITSAGGGITFVNPTTTGELNVVLAQGATDDFTGAYYWELELTDGSGNMNVVAYGELEIKLNL